MTSLFITRKTKAITFAATRRDFTTALNSRVNEYFKSGNIDKYGNAEMVIKTFCMFSAYLVPYILIITGVVTGFWPLIISIVLMSAGLAGIGLSVMHDANHGAYSRHKWVNILLGYSLNLIGANAFTWKMQHNILHHTFTNVHEEDEDIGARGLLRFSPHAEWKRMHRFQFIYAWFLYGLMTLAWMFAKDFVRINRYHKIGLAKKHDAKIAREWFILIATKIFYIGYIIALPFIFTSLAWWQVLLGVFIMHYITGFILAIIFQSAHVLEGTEFPLPDEKNQLENNWAIHQLLTTTNFGNKSRWFSWFVGGLNFQIEHHLFPNICHVHYRKISAIVRSTTMEFGLPYKTTGTFLQALVKHFHLLKQLGLEPTTR